MRGFLGVVVVKWILRQQEGDLFTKRNTHTYTTREMLIYMAVHAVSIFFTILISFLCYPSRSLNAIIIAVIIACAIWNGSTTYAKTLYASELMTIMVRKLEAVPQAP